MIHNFIKYTFSLLLLFTVTLTNVFNPTFLHYDDIELLELSANGEQAVDSEELEASEGHEIDFYLNDLYSYLHNEGDQVFLKDAAFYTIGNSYTDIPALPPEYSFHSY